SEAAVAELRRRKRRDAKPFALLVADSVAAEAICKVDAVERLLLDSVAAPIVLLAKREDTAVAASVAPGLRARVVMLPSTPLHHLLARELGRPLVLTSGNLSDEPMSYEDDEARDRLGGLVDFVVEHDRPIALRCDDSVLRVTAGAPLPIRRSRGYAPLPLTI